MKQQNLWKTKTEFVVVTRVGGTEFVVIIVKYFNKRFAIVFLLVLRQRRLKYFSSVSVSTEVLYWGMVVGGKAGR